MAITPYGFCKSSFPRHVFAAMSMTYSTFIKPSSHALRTSPPLLISFYSTSVSLSSSKHTHKSKHPIVSLLDIGGVKINKDGNHPPLKIESFFRFISIWLILYAWCESWGIFGWWVLSYWVLLGCCRCGKGEWPREQRSRFNFFQTGIAASSERSSPNWDFKECHLWLLRRKLSKQLLEIRWPLPDCFRQGGMAKLLLEWLSFTCGNFSWMWR